jgi:glucan 1,3-beta-glucosidase
MSNIARITLSLLAGCLVAVLFAASRGGEVTIPEPPLASLGCVSYAHPEDVLILGERPPVARADVERELRAVAKMASCIRVYSSDPRQDQILPVARELGLKVLLGAWVNKHPETSRPELERAIALAKAYPDVVTALLIGNEVLTVKEMPLAALTPYLDEARARSPVPVSVAEVWSIWLDQPELAEHVDFIATHVLPYWDGKPGSLQAAFDFVETSLHKLELRFPGKHILIAETGWPSGGRAKGGFPPGRVEQARFIRGVAAMAARHGWTYNVVESYDQQWKRYSEGVAGGTWGILDGSGAPKFPLAGPIEARPQWPLEAGGAVALGLVGLALVHRRPRAWVVAGIAPLLGLLLIDQGTFLIAWISGWVRAMMAVSIFAASLAVAWGCLRALAEGVAYPAPSFAALRRPLTQPLAALLSFAQGVALFLCLEEPFEIPADYYTPVFIIAALAALLAGSAASRPRWERWLGGLLPLGGLLVIALAGPNVGQGWGWAAVMTALAVPLLPARWRRAIGLGVARPQEG